MFTKFKYLHLSKKQKIITSIHKTRVEKTGILVNHVE